MLMQAEKPVAQAQINMKDVITLTARLAQVLAEEVDLLNDMKVSKIKDLQEEKLFLASALEAHKKLLKNNPELGATISAADRRDYAAVVRVFEDMLAENHRKLLVAREVNHQVVQAIRDVVMETSRSRVYDGAGMIGGLGGESLSVTLNKVI